MINKASWQKIKRITFFIRPYRGRLVILILTHLFRSGLGYAFMILPYLMLKNPTLESIKAQFLKWAPLLGGIVVLSIFMTIGYTYLSQYVGARMVYDIRRYFYDHLQFLSLRFFANRPTGEIMSRLLADVANIQGLLSSTVQAILENILRFITFAAVVFSISWKLSLIALAPFPLYLLSVFVFGRIIRVIALRLQRQLAEVSAFIQESFSGIKLIKSFVREKKRLEDFEDRTDKLAKTIVHSGMIRVYQSQINYIIQLGAMVLLLVFGYWEVQSGRMNVFQVLYYYMLLQMMTGPLLTLFQMNLQVQQTMASVDRVLEYLDEQPEITNIADPLAAGALKKGIQFRDVSFFYEDNKSVLHDINLAINKHETVALVGYSGSGKSTMISLLCRFYDPQKGRVEVDGRDLKDYDIAGWRNMTGMVDQDTFLFHTTIVENVRFGNPQASDEDVEQACRAAYLHDFVVSLPMGYQTLCGERGVKLSGGEKQRLAIARAILKDPQILILDEATSSLDSKAENIIKKAITGLLADRTSIIIAHRLSTIMQADKIVVMDMGRIVEVGTYQALLKQNGVFKKLHSEQFFQQPEPKLPDLKGERNN